MCCQQHVTVEVGVNNPTDFELTLAVEVEGHGLTTGASTLVLAPRERQVYQLSFAPTAVGDHDGRSAALCIVVYLFI